MEDDKIIKKLFMRIEKHKQKIALLLLSFILCTNAGNSQEKAPAINKTEIKDFLKEFSAYKDPNPLWQAEADTVNWFFLKALNKKLQKQNSEHLKTHALSLLHENCACEFEDAVDVERTKQKKCLCFLSLSLISDSNSNSFIQDARSCLEEANYPRENAIIDLTEILILSEMENQKDIVKKKVDTLHHNICMCKKDIADDTFVKKLCRLLAGIKKAPKE